MRFLPTYHEWDLFDDQGNIIFSLDDPEWVYDCISRSDVEYKLTSIVDTLFMEEYDNEDYQTFLYGLTDEQRNEAVELMATTLFNFYRPS